ncbi:MAG: sarcosine oxidase subunit gamma [Rhizobiales bacterium 65-79]|jgi:sarcosine oxidase subunit gamma|nr:sarcosine oxidase subunit gamma family protein [Hyphomicrobiales bacterium]OJU06639.1 MAG: sarcosine oxidase subunit gamma [Rhizobiales bacterium 65-79]
MVEPLSPLAPVWKPGSHGNFVDGVGVVLSETRPGSIVEAAAWHGAEKKLMAAIRKATGLSLPDGAGAGAYADGRGAFGIAPGRFLLADQAEGLAERLSAAVAADTGTVTDLSHGRTAIRVAGPKAEWLLSKFFAIDFALPAFPVGSGLATVHHDIFAQIQRTGENAFDLYVFRSFARSFWTMLGHGAEEAGYEVR